MSGRQAGSIRDSYFSTPPRIVELWRTAPFLHDGSCASLHELITSRNTENRHGRTSHLTRAQIDDLVEFLLSL